MAPHMRHLPDLMQEIARVDHEIDTLRSGHLVEFGDVLALADLRRRRADLRDRAHEIYGHTPARGDRGPSSAAALAAR